MQRERPLVHVITNFVTMNDVANAALAIGARPIMAHAAEEVAEVARAARTVVLNLGTLSRERIETMRIAGRAANSANIPVVFDPVGVGASAFRKEAAAHILDSLQVSILRGNAGEIGTLAGIEGALSGVDAAAAEYDRADVAQSLAQKRQTTVVITGKTDFVSDGSRVVTIENGHPWLKLIAGAGDMLDAVMGAASAVERDALIAASSALVWFGIAAECAAENSRGIGYFRVGLFDALGNLNAETIEQRGKWHEPKKEE